MQSLLNLLSKIINLSMTLTLVKLWKYILFDIRVIIFHYSNGHSYYYIITIRFIFKRENILVADVLYNSNYKNKNR